jgi:hypothetical protein
VGGLISEYRRAALASEKLLVSGYERVWHGTDFLCAECCRVPEATLPGRGWGSTGSVSAKADIRHNRAERMRARRRSRHKPRLRWQK